MGGAERVVVNLARLQSERGHSVAIGCLFSEGPLATHARSAGVEVSNFGKRAGLDLGSVLRMRNWLRTKNPDVLHTHNPTAHYYAVAAALGLRIGRVINTRHGMGTEGAGTRREVLFRIAMHRSDRAVVVCEAARKSFVERRAISESKAVTIPNGIELSRLSQRNAAAKRSLLASLLLPGNPFVFGSVGRLSPVKDQATMLRAFQRLLRQVSTVTPEPGTAAILVIAGDGEERKALEQECNRLGLEGQVFLLGQRDDVPEILAGLDTFLLSSRSEGYSLALVEAAATGLPIVASDVGGNSEIVQTGVNGLLVPAGSLDALADAMQRLFEHEEERIRMGSAGRRWAQENGSIESMYERYVALYRSDHAEPVMSAKDVRS